LNFRKRYHNAEEYGKVFSSFMAFNFGRRSCAEHQSEHLNLCVGSSNIIIFSANATNVAEKHLLLPWPEGHGYLLSGAHAPGRGASCGVGTSSRDLERDADRHL